MAGIEAEVWTFGILGSDTAVRGHWTFFDISHLLYHLQVSFTF